MQIKLLGIISVGFNMTDQLPVIYSAHIRPTNFRKNGNTMQQRTSYL